MEAIWYLFLGEKYSHKTCHKQNNYFPELNNKPEKHKVNI